MKRVLFIGALVAAACCLFASHSNAQVGYVNRDSTWFFNGNAAVTFNQTFLQNWVAGGENSLGGEATLMLNLRYKKDKHDWNNTLNLGYGIIKQGEKEIIKNLDKIDFASQYGYKATKSWFYSGLYSMKTQFAPGYNYDKKTGAKLGHFISNIFSPVYNSLALGMDYKPDAHFSLFLSPLTGRNTYVMDDTLALAGAFGVKVNKKDDGTLVPTHTLWELGGSLRATYVNAFFNNKLGLNTKLELFSNYLNKPQNIDVNFDLILDYKFNDYLSARAQITMVYDDDQKTLNKEGKSVAQLQIRQMFGVGVAYRF